MNEIKQEISPSQIYWPTKEPVEKKEAYMKEEICRRRKK